YLFKPIRRGDLLKAIRTAMALPAENERRPRVALDSPRKASASLTILLAEDNLVNQRLAARILEKWGHEIVVADTGRRALEFLEKRSFDMVFMDVQMPVMDG